MQNVKNALQNIENCFYGDSPEVELTQVRPVILPERLDKCSTAQDVFREYSVDAAAGKVREMMKAKTSGDRQRAQETVLGYGLGKPVNRSLSYSVQIGDATDEELTHGIRSLLIELGFSSGEGASSRIFIGPKTIEGSVKTPEVQAESGVSGQLPEVREEDPNLPDG